MSDPSSPAVVIDKRLVDNARHRDTSHGDPHENGDSRPVIGTLDVLSRSVQGIDPDANVVGLRLRTRRDVKLDWLDEFSSLVDNFDRNCLIVFINRPIRVDGSRLCQRAFE